jgi:hypothetical protein
VEIYLKNASAPQASAEDSFLGQFASDQSYEDK